MIKYDLRQLEIEYTFKLYGNCLFCKGFKNTIILDLQFSRYMNVPNDLAEVVGLNNKFIRDNYSESDQNIILDFFNTLCLHGFGFYTREGDNFPEISLKWDSPSILNHCILYYDIGEPKYSLTDLINNLSNLNCKHALFYGTGVFNEDDIFKTLNVFNNTSFTSIILVINASNLVTIKGIIKNVCSNFPIVEEIIFSEYINASNLESTYTYKGLIIRHTKIGINQFHKACGYISDSNFTINIQTYTESLQYNSCLNGKIVIDLDGNIKNCPAMKELYGNINVISLTDILVKTNFKEKWNITKDKIASCKDCEFRYICTDCRAFLESPEDIFSKPLKCGYDPYKGEWNDWSANPLKLNAINMYEL